MLRVALFVEGHTELCLIREMLLKHHNYSNVNICCLELHSSNLLDVPYKFDSGGVYEFDYQIICTNGDAVISRAAERSRFLDQGGFDLVVGLRDIYSQEYDEISAGLIDEKLIAEMITRQRDLFDSRVVCNSDKHLCFSRMEIEAWYLSMPTLLMRLTGAKDDREHTDLYVDGLRKNFEREVYRPALLLNAVCNRFGKSYTKSRDESNRIANLLEYTDLTTLRDNNEVTHFNDLWDRLRL
ncbi:MAG: hypothetical protein KF905_09885 [Flavobacteriales bacterium]|nr:hypothetical protein [Flavobacteriales bacterium]